ncbi:MAG: COX aromatic rich motif-containing protein [Comamonas sp.]
MLKRTISLSAPCAALLLSGCDWALINPAGYIARQQSNLMIFSVVVMLLIVVPVIAATLGFALKYRAHRGATYDPGFHHSSKLELLIWGVPIATIGLLATVTWGSTHLLDPYRPLTRIDSQTRIAGVDEDLGAVKRFSNRFIDPGRSDAATAATADVGKPLLIEVAALDWKWLFIYPELGIATVNEVAAPVNRPITFKITSASMMNSFFIPSLAGQIYAMPGMQTQLHAVVNREGAYKGFSGNYTGYGFSQMYFYFHGLSDAAFGEWVAKVRGAGKALDRAEYQALDQFDQKNARGNVAYFGTRYYSRVDDGLFHAIANMCAIPGLMCMDEMMHIDMAGGGGADSQANYQRLQYDRRRDFNTRMALAGYAGIPMTETVCTATETATDTAATTVTNTANPTVPGTAAGAL